MLHSFFILVATIFAAPALSVQWAKQGEAVSIVLDGSDENVDQCLRSGLEVRYRYEVKVCVKRELWWDNCTERYRELRTAQFDPVAESYQMTSDIYLDQDDPLISVHSTFEEVRDALGSMDRVPLQRFGSEVAELLKKQKVFLSVRVRGACLDNERSLEAQIPYYLTFGQIRFTGFNSGWVDFWLDRK